VKPGDQHLGDQIQRTSYRPSTFDPVWQPPESFQLATSNLDATISLFVYSLRKYSPVTTCVLVDDEKARRIPLGVAYLNIKDITDGTVSNSTLHLTNIDDGSSSGGQVSTGHFKCMCRLHNSNNIYAAEHPCRANLSQSRNIIPRRHRV
jgi:hypothetical protein